VKLACECHAGVGRVDAGALGLHGDQPPGVAQVENYARAGVRLANVHAPGVVCVRRRLS